MCTCVRGGGGGVHQPMHVKVRGWNHLPQIDVGAGNRNSGPPHVYVAGTLTIEPALQPLIFCIPRFLRGLSQ